MPRGFREVHITGTMQVAYLPNDSLYMCKRCWRAVSVSGQGDDAPFILSDCAVIHAKCATDEERAEEAHGRDEIRKRISRAPIGG